MSSSHWLGLAALIFVADQVTKHLASGLLALAEPVAVMPHLNLTLLHNTGAAFSFLNDAAGWQRWLFTAIAFVVSIVIVVWLRRMQRAQRWVPAALSLILGGALGNLGDRIRVGYVIDFIQVYHGDWAFPAFNIADSAITVGAVMLIMHGTIVGRHADPGT